jgi:hypothetical protein
VTYTELATLNALLRQFHIEHANRSSPAVTEVQRIVARMAGKRREEPGRHCCWCGKPTVDPHPQLCNRCIDQLQGRVNG